MSFDFDTGPELTTRQKISEAIGGTRDAVLDAVKDSLPSDATQAQTDAAYILYMTGWVREPKTAPTIIRRLGLSLRELEDIATRDVALANSLILEIADRLDRLS